MFSKEMLLSKPSITISLGWKIRVTRWTSSSGDRTASTYGLRRRDDIVQTIGNPPNLTYFGTSYWDEGPATTIVPTENFNSGERFLIVEDGREITLTSLTDSGNIESFLQLFKASDEGKILTVAFYPR